MSRDPVAVWAEQTIKVWPESYYLIDVGDDGLALALKALEISTSRYACVIRDQTGFSLVVDEETWGVVAGQAVIREKFGPLKVISTDSPLPFDVVGFIQAALREVNGAGFKAAPQCGLAADHFFTGAADIEAVEGLFRQLIEKAKAA
jgi:hypothetical protein